MSTTAPCRIDGWPRIKRNGPGTRLVLHRRVRLFRGVAFYLERAGATVTIGERTYINRRSEVMCAVDVQIGASCAISWDVTISDTDYHAIDDRPRSQPVRIGDRVWIGSGATILKGVTIGDGAVIAAKAVVTRDVPEAALAAGNPATVIRHGVSWTG